MWYLWPTLEAFEAWHDSVCASLGIPHPNRNVATGELDLDAEWTTSYTDVTQVQDGWFAFVDPEVALANPDGLGAEYTPTVRYLEAPNAN